MFDLTGKTALVTGGNGGIGLGIALGLAKSGAKIAITGRNQLKITEALGKLTQTDPNAIGLLLDVTKENSVRNIVRQTQEHFGRIDILVNSAGTVIRKHPQDTTIEEWDRVQEVNLRGSFLCAKEVYPLMASAQSGKIINIGSMTSISGSDWAASYSASKGGIVQLTKSLALSWSANNIQVNSILPGWIHTDLTADIKKNHPERYSLIASRIPQGRWGKPSDVAGTAIFLASPASDYVTGVAIPVDGGYIAS